MQLDSLVEVHTEKELAAAVDAGAEMIGINNRDLKTFAVSLATTERLAPLVPAGKPAVCESGIDSLEQIRRVEKLGIHAFLIGESLMRAPEPGEVESFEGNSCIVTRDRDERQARLSYEHVVEHDMVKVKVCGITYLTDAEKALEFGADMLGFNFYPPSPRSIAPEKAREIIARLPRDSFNVALFVNEPRESVIASVARGELAGWPAGVSRLAIPRRGERGVLPRLGHESDQGLSRERAIFARRHGKYFRRIFICSIPCRRVTAVRGTSFRGSGSTASTPAS